MVYNYDKTHLFGDLQTLHTPPTTSQGQVGRYVLEPPTTCTHHLIHTTYDFHKQPTTSTHHLRLLHTTYDFHTPPTTSTHHLRPAWGPGREMTRNCLEIEEGEGHVTSCTKRRPLGRCYGDVTTIITIPFSFKGTALLRVQL